VATGGLVGQDAALAVLRAAVDDAVRGRGGLVLVAGEAGIGKTAVVSDIAMPQRDPRTTAGRRGRPVSRLLTYARVSSAEPVLEGHCPARSGPLE
jgi:hypothetical protein